MRITESALRRIIREELLNETRQGFLDRTANVKYSTGLSNDFDVPKKEKPKARQIKQIWNEEADHGFMDSLIKVHWIHGRTNHEFDSVVAAIKRLINTPGNNEISTSAYLPGTRIESDWGQYGVIVKGRTTLAVNNMDWLYTGHHGKAPETEKEKYRASGTRKHADSFDSKRARQYVLDRDSFDPEWSHRNEFVVSHWEPVAIIQRARAISDIPDSLRERVMNLARIERDLVETGEIPREKFVYMLTCKKITLDMVREMSRKELETFYSLNCKEHMRPEPDSMSSIGVYKTLKRVLVGSPELEQFGLPIVDADLRSVGDHK